MRFLLRLSSRTHFVSFPFLRFDLIELRLIPVMDALVCIYIVYLWCMGVLSPCAYSVYVCMSACWHRVWWKGKCVTRSQASLFTTEYYNIERNKPKSEELSLNTKSLLHRHRILGINPFLSFPLSSSSFSLSISFIHSDLFSSPYSRWAWARHDTKYMCINRTDAHTNIIVAYLHTNGHRINYS